MPMTLHNTRRNTNKLSKTLIKYLISSTKQRIKIELVRKNVYILPITVCKQRQIVI